MADFTLLLRSPRSARIRAVCTSSEWSCPFAKIRNSSRPTLTKLPQVSFACSKSTVGIVTSILSLPSGRIMISSVPDGFTRFIRTAMILSAVASLSLSFRFKEPIMLIPPLKSTPNFGGHFEKIINSATRILTATTAARPEYSDTLRELVTKRAKKIPPATAAISSMNKNAPL